MTFKQKIFNQLVENVTQQIEMVNSTLNDLKISATNETKSTAGDKHETALAMLQIEQAMKGGQLEKLQQTKAILLKIDPTLTHNIVRLGSLVYTSNGCFFMSVAMPAILIDEKKIIAISSTSPLGQLFIGLKANEKATFNKMVYIIEKIE